MITSASCGSFMPRSLTRLIDMIAELAGHAAMLADTASQQRVVTEEYASSLTIACDSLRLAGVFLTGRAADTSPAVETREAAPLHDESTPVEANAAVEHLIREAHQRLAQLLPVYSPNKETS